MLHLHRSVRHEISVDVLGGRVSKRAHTVEGRARLATEAAALQALQGVNGVATLLEWNGEAVITRHVPGVPLLQWWVDQPQADRAALACSLVTVVMAVHARGIAHRDLAPDNIIVTPEGQPVLIDWELARLPGHAHGGGTPANAAPELRWLPDPRLLDRRVDVYALGLLLQHLLLETSWGLTGEALVERLLATPAPKAGLSGWLQAMTHPQRRHRPTDLAPLLCTLRGDPQPAPVAEPVPFPAALCTAIEQVTDEAGPQWSAVLAVAFRSLVPTDGLGDSLAEQDWLRWARQIVRAKQLRQQSDSAAQWEAAELELQCGLPWTMLANAHAPAAAMAVQLDAPRTARRLLSASTDGNGDGTALAWHAAVVSRLGDVQKTAGMVSAALQNRPTDPACQRWFWNGLCRALLAAGSLSDVTRLLPALPPAERGGSIAAVLPALARLLDSTAQQHHHRVRRAGAYGALADVALDSTLREVALVLGEVSLWVVAAQIDELPVEDWLHRAGTILHNRLPEDSVGPVFLVVSAVLGQDVAAQKAAHGHLKAITASARPIPSRQQAAAWAREHLQPPEVAMPSWALDAPSEATPQQPADEREAMALLATEGVDAAMAVVLKQLQQTPRSPRFWAVALQLMCVAIKTVPSTKADDAFGLLDALQAAGMGAAALLPWRMRLFLLREQPEQAIATLVSAQNDFPPMWMAWVLSVDAWVALKQPGRAQEAVQFLAQARAPEAVLAHVRSVVESL